MTEKTLADQEAEKQTQIGADPPEGQTSTAAGVCINEILLISPFLLLVTLLRDLPSLSCMFLYLELGTPSPPPGNSISTKNLLVSIPDLGLPPQNLD